MIKFEAQILASDEAIDHLDKINLQFVKTNLDLVDFDKMYIVKKIKDTSGKSPIPNNKTVISRACSPMLVVMQFAEFNPRKILLALYFEEYYRIFRTSPIKNVTKQGNSILVETENSIYELTEA